MCKESGFVTSTVLSGAYLCLPLALILAILAGLLGCQGTGEGITSQETGVTGGQPAANGFPGLVAPAEILKHPAAVYTYSRIIPGPEYDATLPANAVSIDEDVALFNPNWNPKADPPSVELAYAVYGLRHPELGSSGAELELNWQGVPPDSSNCWVGLANWQLNRWDWYRYPAEGVLEFNGPYRYHYVNISRQANIVVVLTGTGGHRLQWVRFGQNLAPVVSLSSREDNLGSYPVEVTLTASAYDLDGEVSLIEWDLDGSEDYLGQLGGTEAAVLIEEPGKYFIRVRVTDDDGKRTTALQELLIGPWFGKSLGWYGGHGYFSMVVDDTGNPHVCGVAEKGTLIYAWYDGAKWVSEDIDDIVNQYADCASIALDAEGNPYIAHCSWDLAMLRFASKTTGSWQVEDVDGIAAGSAYSGYFDAQLVIGSDGQPHIAYTSSEIKYAGNDLKYAKLEGGEWQIEVARPDDVFTEMDIVLDATGFPHIGCVTTTSGNHVTHVFNDGSAWQSELVMPGDKYGEVLLDMAQDGSLHLVFSIYNRIVYASNSAGDWQTTPIVVLTENSLGGASLALASDGTPHVSWVQLQDMMWAGFIELMHAEQDEGDWPTTEILHDGALSDTFITLDSTGRPLITYIQMGINQVLRVE